MNCIPFYKSFHSKMSIGVTDKKKIRLINNNNKIYLKPGVHLNLYFQIFFHKSIFFNHIFLNYKYKMFMSFFLWLCFHTNLNEPCHLLDFKDVLLSVISHPVL